MCSSVEMNELQGLLPDSGNRTLLEMSGSMTKDELKKCRLYVSIF